MQSTRDSRVNQSRITQINQSSSLVASVRIAALFLSNNPLLLVQYDKLCPAGNTQYISYVYIVCMYLCMYVSLTCTTVVGQATVGH